MGPIGCPETSVRNYSHSLRNDQEQSSSLLMIFNNIGVTLLLPIGTMGKKIICFYATFAAYQFIFPSVDVRLYCCARAATPRFAT